MKIKPVVKPLAATRIAEVYDWYENQRDGLGLEFLDEWDATTDRIAVNPETFQKKYRNFRLAHFDRFPYMAVYIYDVQENSIVIYNVLASKQHPAKRYRKK